MHPLIQNNVEQIQALCKQHHVKTLYVFGSVVRSDFNEKSDVDFLVEFNNISDIVERVENSDDLKEKLQTLLFKEVDLIQAAHLRNKYLKYFINNEKKLIYAEA